MKSPQFKLQAEMEEEHWWHRGKKRILSALIRHLLPGSGSLVVDVGCGTGGNAAFLAREHRVAGIDASAEAVEFARTRYPGVRFIHGSAPEDLGALAGQADLYLLSDVLEHVRDDREFLARLVGAARPGAHFLIAVPADMSLWSPHDVSLGHYRRYGPESLARAWSGLPVSVRLLSYYNARLYFLAKAARLWGRWRGKAVGEAGTDVGKVARPLNGWLETIFAGESRILIDLLRGRRAAGYPRGVSLIALLRREA